jgi:hypothetical protein
MNIQDFNALVDRVCGQPVANKPRGLMIFKGFDRPKTRAERKRGYGAQLWEEAAKNGTTVVGVTAMMNAWFNVGTQPATFYMGLIDNTSFSSVSTADTAASHPNWLELAGGGVGYSGNRPAWGQGSASSGICTNASPVNFSITATVTIKGAFTCTAATGVSMVLYSTALLTGTQTLSSGQTLSITYTSQVTAG